jgi:hypothetical protein
MNKRFAYELAVGIITIIAVLLFGMKGNAVLALLAFQPFIGKKKGWDEREFQLFYRVGNYTAGASLLACVIIYECSDLIFNGQEIGKNWLGLVVSSFIIAHGAAGRLIFKKN